MTRGTGIRVARIEAQPGEHEFGYLDTGTSRSGLAPDIPVHLVAGVEPGPTLLVQAAIHGTEVIGTIAILEFVKALGPEGLTGNVIAVPVVNRVGFELNDRLNTVDGKDISRLFPGNPSGSLSEQIAHAYFEHVIKHADVMIDFHAAAKGYERYIVFPVEKDPAHPTVLEQRRRRLIVAFGLDAASFPPDTFGTNLAEEAIAQAGVVWFQPEVGGGAGWFEHGEENVRDCVRGIRNVMRAMRMIDGAFEWDGPLCTIYNACVVLWKPPVDGLFVRHKGMGATVRAGEVYGTIQHPYTGTVVAEIRSPQEAIVIPGGLESPVMGTTTVGILGVVERVEDRRTAGLYVDFTRGEPR